LAGDQGPGGDMRQPIVSLIAAVARNGAIGIGDVLPWRLSSDLKRLKAKTMGKPLIMGRKTFQSIGVPLRGRFCIIVTRDPAFSAPDAELVDSIGEALEIARAHGTDEIFVGGGGEIYAQTIGLADRLYITEVELAPEGDALFPAIDPALWREAARESGVRGPRDDADFAFVDYERR
jgi:dihydrofolate reductase